MVRNINNVDKMARVVLAVALIVVGFLLQGDNGIIALIIPAAIGLILLATVFLNFCPIYRMIGFSTCPDGEC